jgi:hypothetical protein
MQAIAYFFSVLQKHGDTSLVKTAGWIEGNKVLKDSADGGSSDYDDITIRLKKQTPHENQGQQRLQAWPRLPGGGCTLGAINHQRNRCGMRRTTSAYLNTGRLCA